MTSDRKRLSAEHRAKIAAGLSGRPVSAETRAKLSAAHTGKKMSAAACAKMSVQHAGKTLSPEHRAKIGASLLGTHHVGRIPPPKTAETRAKLSATNKGQKPSHAAIAASVAARKGKPQKPEAVERRRQALLGTRWTAEARERFSQNRRAAFADGRMTTSPETRRKHSEAQKRAWVEGRLSVPHVVRYTSLAKALHVHLAATGLTLEIEVRFGRYTVDLYDREHHIAYEADGAHWHDIREARDPGYSTRRDDYLMQSFGLKVVHFTDREISTLTGWPNKKRRPEVA